MRGRARRKRGGKRPGASRRDLEGKEHSFLKIKGYSQDLEENLYRRGGEAMTTEKANSGRGALGGLFGRGVRIFQKKEKAFPRQSPGYW